MSCSNLISHLLFSFFFIIKAIYVPADDLTDPAPATTFAHLDATTVLSRSIAELGKEQHKHICIYIDVYFFFSVFAILFFS